MPQQNSLTQKVKKTKVFYDILALIDQLSLEQLKALKIEIDGEVYYREHKQGNTSIESL